MKQQMKLKVLFLLVITALSAQVISAQRGVRIGYIDTEYILKNVPEYQDATAQLEQKVQKWKGEIEGRLKTVEQKRKELANEKALLTKELIEEREEDIKYEELEILDYQQKRFGPNGDLMIQKKQLMQPVQDQIFAAVQDIAAKKKYDFVFDKSADVVMLYSANRFDFSDLVIRTITRSAKRKQAQSRADRKKAEDEDVVIEVNEDLEARKKALEDKKAKRASEAEAKRAEILKQRNARKEAAQKRRDSILAARKAARDAKLNQRNTTPPSETDDNTSDKKASDTKADVKTEDAPKTREQILEERRQKKLADRKARKDALEARKRKILEDRKKKKAQQDNSPTEEDDNDDGE